VSDEARLFLAIPPPPALWERLMQLQAALEGGSWRLKPSPPEDLHLTLHFLGATPLRVVDDLKREVGALCHSRRRFDLACGGLGCFPDEAEPRVVYAAVQDPAGKLEDLFQASRRILNAYRLFKLRDELQPHVTLARVQSLCAAWDPARLRGLAASHGALGPYPVERVQLMQSHVGVPDGPRYECLAELGLA
jgi:2'-5' RNA ligase